MSPFRTWCPHWAALAALYFVAAKGGLALAYAHGQVTAVWPPSGIALAAAFICGYRVLPGVLVGAFLANVSTGAPVPTDLGIGIGNSAEALVGALLLRQAGFRPSLARIRDVAALALLAAGVSTLLGATVGTASLLYGRLIEPQDLPSVWRVWWLGDAGGDLLIAPVLIMIARGAFSARLSRRRAAEAVCLAIVVVGVSVVSLSSNGSLYLVFPVLIWAALRFRQPGATAASVTLAGLAVWFTAHRIGPFVRSSPDDSLLLSQSFIGVVHMTVLVLAAVTARREKTEHAVREDEQRKTAMLDAALDGVITTDHAGRIIEFNRAAERTFGYPLADARGKQFADLIIPPRVRGAARRLAGEGNLLARRMETVGVRADGVEFPIELSVTRINTDGPPVFTAFVRDISERKQVEERLRFMAEHDPLTGLINRRRFELELNRQIALTDRYDLGGALLALDVDNLKHVNDAFGHAAGDRLLRSISGVLQRHLRSTDVVARLGGDEFFAILSAVDEHQASAVAEVLLDAVRGNLIHYEGHEIRATLSVGIAAITRASKPDALLAQADRAMYRAKERGRDRVIAYDLSELESVEGTGTS